MGVFKNDLDMPSLARQEGTFTNYDKRVVPTNAALSYDGFELNDIANALGINTEFTIDYTPNLGVNFKNIKNEFLVIFLEKGYFSGISKAFEIEMRKKIIEHVEKKAINMGVVSAFSEDYNIALIDSDKYISQNFDMFISHSKAGKQYLDSLGGRTSISNEGKYYSGRFILPVNV